MQERMARRRIPPMEEATAMTMVLLSSIQERTLPPKEEPLH
jgi:hypothetical protein